MLKTNGNNGNSKKVILRHVTRLIKLYNSSLEILNEIEVDCSFTNGYSEMTKLINRFRDNYDSISSIYRDLVKEVLKNKKKD